MSAYVRLRVVSEGRPSSPLIGFVCRAGLEWRSLPRLLDLFQWMYGPKVVHTSLVCCICSFVHSLSRTCHGNRSKEDFPDEGHWCPRGRSPVDDSTSTMSFHVTCESTWSSVLPRDWNRNPGSIHRRRVSPHVGRHSLMVGAEIKSPTVFQVCAVKYTFTGRM